jgi:hypothetical protein
MRLFECGDLLREILAGLANQGGSGRILPILFHSIGAAR